ncbi:MAG: hypothetical protein HYV63_32465 [Candidatus Schekmanbacteria bacterium]|nr:hypothetical protein [Candidatus Schekmanbacteria bacterium]
MSMRLIATCAAVAAVAGLIAWHVLFRTGPVEQVIRETASALERELPESVLANLADTFDDGHHTSKSEVAVLLAEAFRRYDNIRILFDHIDIIEGRAAAEADVSFRVLLSYQGVRGMALGSLQNPERVLLVLEKDDTGKLRIRSLKGLGKLAPLVQGKRRPTP